VLKKLIIAILLVSIGATATLVFQFDKALKVPLSIKEDRFLTVEAGSSISSFARQLEKNNWIENRFWLRNYGRLFPEKANIKAGTYLITKGTHLSALLTQLIEGKEHQFSVTFIEGTRFIDALAILSQHPHIKQSLHAKALTDVAHELGIDRANPEGWLFPDTYAFTAGTLDIAILKRAHANMKQQLNVLWSARAENLPYKSAYEALIMASIIEKETSFIAEQPIISSVFINRLRKRMRYKQIQPLYTD